MRPIVLFFLLMLFIHSLYPQVNLDSGLVAHYPFNGNADDESGNDNHGTVMGAMLTSDRFGSDSSAYEFDGTSTYITIANSPSLQSPTTELSQIAWINIYGWSIVGTQFGPILMKSNTGANAFQYRLSVGSTGVNTSINNWFNAVTVFDTLLFNQWYLIVSVLKDDTVKAYLNGNYIGEGILSGPINPDSRPLEIGRDVPGLTEIFYGKLDDIRIYDRALTQLEIDSLYNEQLTSIAGTNHSIPMFLELKQNYPNPFNPTTKISWQLAVSSPVTLTIFNLAGQRVTTLVHENQAAGLHTVQFNGSGLASGVYFYRLEAGDYVDMRKMVLMR